MSFPVHDTRLSVAKLEQAIQAVEPAALLVEPRILRRVIKQDRRIAGLGLHVPHQHAYVIQRDRLLVIVERAELMLSPAAELPRKVILLARPGDSELTDTSADDVLHAYWRKLFHARVHLDVQQRIAENKLTLDDVVSRRRKIGATEFDEIRSVLHKDDLLLPPGDDMETYVEFLAVYLELRYFAPYDLTSYFPAIKDWEAIDDLVGEDVDHGRIYEETRLQGAPLQSSGQRALTESGYESPSADGGPVDPLQPSPPRFWRLVARAERAGLVGNGVKAAILRTRARRLALPERSSEMQIAAEAELERVVRRMQVALQLPEDLTSSWVSALMPLLQRAARDRLSAEARLLYDLQKVCLEHERGVYRVALLGWLVSRGRKRLKRPLPLLRQVLITKHLRSASRRLSTLRVEPSARERIEQLLADALHRTESQLRSELRPLIAGVLDDVGLVPGNVPQRVARRKIIEELLDRVVERGFVNMGDLRDSLSQNNLKLSDVSAWEAIKGDQLLRADWRLSSVLEGVYRRGAVYLRVPQRLSSLAFGTAMGRFLVRYLFLPFGSAFLALYFVCVMAKPVLHYSGISPEPPVAAANSPIAPAVQAETDTEESGDGQPDAAADATTPPPPDATTLVDTETDKDAAVDAGGNAPRDGPTGAADGVGGTAVAQGDESPGDLPAATTTPPPATANTAADALSPAEVEASAFHLQPWFQMTVLILGLLIMMLIHLPRFRRGFFRTLTLTGKGLRLLLVDWPATLARSRLVQRILQSHAYTVVRNYVLRPGVFSAFVLLPRMIRPQTWSWDLALHVFLGFNLFLNSPIGKYADERVTDVLVRAWHELRIRVLAAAYHWTVDLFHQLLEGLERLLYVVDEWMRFRRGDSRIFLFIKGVFGTLWSIVQYVIRIYVTLLIEPQVNPIKHFPVVTVSHKIMLPYSIYLTEWLAAPMQPFLGVVLANSFAFATVVLLPGVFGFLVWELKENWRLFSANRATTLVPSAMGHHGETMAGLLRPGFHSGTLPKAFARLRRASRAAAITGEWKPVNQRRAVLQRVEEAVRHFFDREFCALLEEDGGISGPRIRTGAIGLASNRIEVELARERHESACLVLEERHGWLTATLRNPGWIDELPEQQRTVCEVALAGIYKLAAIDLVREFVEAALPERCDHYEITDAGLAVYDAQAGNGRISYPIRRSRHRVIPHKPSGEIAVDWPTLQRSTLVFSDSSIPWQWWVDYWAHHERTTLPGPLTMATMRGEHAIIVETESDNGSDHADSATAERTSDHALRGDENA